MNDNNESTTVKNPDRNYVPSGKSSNSSLYIYVLYGVIIAVLIQIPFGLTEALIGFIVRFSSGIWLFISPILFGGIGFFISGSILGYLISLATKRAQCRNTNAEIIATVVTIALSFFFRLIVTTVTFTFLDIGNNLNAKTALDLPNPYWIETILGFTVLSFGAFISKPKMKPYCEACGKYMIKQQYLFAPSELSRILTEISGISEKPSFNDLKRTNNFFPSNEVLLHMCDQCYCGFLNVNSNIISIKDGKEQKSSSCVYSDELNSVATKAILSAMQANPGTKV